MTGPRFLRLESTESHRHPAVRAWRRLSGDESVPAAVDVLEKVRRKQRSRSIFRLTGLSTPSSTVIAKRCRQVDADRESAIYQQILPHLPLVHPRVFGRVGGESGKYDTWLFLEEVVGQPYDSSLATHRTLAGSWMATLHGHASRVDAGARLASFGLGLRHHSQVLETIRQGIREVESNPALDDDDIALLETIARQCESVRGHWAELEEVGAVVPRTLVHGDLNRANMLVAGTAGQPKLVVFDWEKAGWGIPAMDLARFLGSRANPDLDSYLSVIRQHWPAMDAATVRRLGYVGEIFRWLDALRWQVERLRFEWVDHPLSRMRIYAAWMDDIDRAAPWAPGSSFEQGEWLSAVRL